MYMYISVYVYIHQCIYIECIYMKDKGKEVLLHTTPPLINVFPYLKDKGKEVLLHAST
jgi:hypothetical protein